MNLLRAIKRRIGTRSPLRLFWHAGKAFVAAALNGFPARKLTVIGITGTDGKTTTVNMTVHILRHADTRVGALSTAFVDIDGERTWNATQKTSPSPFLIQRFLHRLVRTGCTHAVLEVSSHGLVQGRLNCTWPQVAAITNLTAEHLDYHGSMAQYETDKGLLFSMLRTRGTKVLNREDHTYAAYCAFSSADTITFGMHGSGADLTLENGTASPNGSQAMLHDARSGDALPLHLSIPGVFNLENALCAIGCAMAVGVAPSVACKALKQFTGTPGRMERIDEGQPFAVFVDFTVTPAAYEKTLTALRDMLEPAKRILVLTGSCGDRMREKRPIVGKLCSELADVVVVSNEDPYTEDPQKIIDEVWAGIDQSACTARQIFDRKEAIRFLLQEAQPGDAVLLCAKGSDTTMWTAEGQVPWDERSITRALLKEIAKK